MKIYLLSVLSALFLIGCGQSDSSAPKVSKPGKETKDSKDSKDSKEPPTAPKHYME